MPLVSSLLSLGSVLTLFIGLNKYRKEARTELVKKTEDDTKHAENIKTELSKITTLSTELTETAKQLKRLERDLVEEKHKIANLSQKQLGVDDDISDIRESINKLYSASHQQAVSLSNLKQISENLMFSVAGLNDRTIINSEKIAEMKGKLGI
jgi:septal ring factor EnvC (AmiA/AmiB activator)